MKVSEAIALLGQMNPDAELFFDDDGFSIPLIDLVNQADGHLYYTYRDSFNGDTTDVEAVYVVLQGDAERRQSMIDAMSKMDV